MTPERIAELRALAEKATPGPWRVRWFPVDTVTGEGGDYVVEAGDIHGHAEELICYGDWDGDFIAAARTAVPELLAEVERLTERANFRTASMKRDATHMGVLIRERDEARDALDRVRGLHRPYRIYGECGHGHTRDEMGAEGSTVVEIEEIGLVCDDGYLHSICRSCCTGNGDQREECADHHDHSRWPICDTIRALDGGGE